MNMIVKLTLCVLLTSLMVGCTGLASVAKQLKDDPAFVTVDVRTLYGTGRLVRDGRAANGNNVTLDAVASIQPPPPVFGPPTQLIYVTNTVVLGLTTNGLTPGTVTFPIAR
jgi:hypothetical protein